MLYGLPATLQGLISTFLWASSPSKPSISPITFQLRHRHAITNDSRVIFSNYEPSASFAGEGTEFTIPVQTTTIPRPESHAAFMAARSNYQRDVTPALNWVDWEVPTPDVTKRSTLLQMAKMAFNAYAPDNSSASDWYDISDGWRSDPHGWGPEDDGLRGHIFVSTDNSTVVISIKGTSAGWLVGGGGPTVAKDKKNDNLLFSCCCARVGPTWSTVCGCYDGNYRCDADCVEDAMKDEGLFYPIGLNLYNNVSYLYPNANIWLTGHSLGGGLTALIGATFGAPVVAFEAPAERMASQRLHLPPPPTINHVTHVYNTADPIPMGTCTGVTSSCAIGGFALETRCHNGQVILYDTVQKLGWSVNIGNHGIKVVTDKILSDTADWKIEFNGPNDEEKGLLSVLNWGWGRRKPEEPEGDDKDGEKERYREVPLARPAIEVEGTDGVCTDCFNWEFGNFKNRSSSASRRCP
ncbi:alpha/beta-hydrolase [Pholiota conissans]|uniref:triacylglycerol lipase n=1 Tax=Pholiota conissans TaxID=109636 RepID=A0A9P5Z8E6_9AGAR|nr:alpha/beta-hydrolase [Pholiota conissans]